MPYILASSFRDSVHCPAFIEAATPLVQDRRAMIVTAAGDYKPGDYLDEWVSREMNNLDILGAAGGTRIDITSEVFDPRAFSSFDLLWVCGGNPRWLDMCLQSVGLAIQIKKRVKEDPNFVYVGESAGSIVASKVIDYIDDEIDFTDINLQHKKEVLDRYRKLPHRGIGLTERKIIPHHNRPLTPEEIRRETKEGWLYLNDGAALICERAVAGIVKERVVGRENIRN